jgi:hypothetical protein
MVKQRKRLKPAEMVKQRKRLKPAVWVKTDGNVKTGSCLCQFSQDNSNEYLYEQYWFICCEAQSLSSNFSSPVAPAAGRRGVGFEPGTLRQKSAAKYCFIQIAKCKRN